MKKKPKWVVPGDMRFHTTEYVVDATGEEYHQIWYRWSEQLGVKFDQDMMGYAAQIGTIDNRPITVSVFWYVVEDLFRVAFVDGVSQLVDYKMISDWEETVFRCLREEHSRHSNATNFGHVVSEIQRRLGKVVVRRKYGDIVQAIRNLPKEK